MACGLPAIATDYPGVRAVVDDGETGLLVGRRRLGGGRRGARPARRHGTRAARARWASAGRAKARAEWSWPALLDRMDDAYAEAIEARAGEGGGRERRAATVDCCSSPTSTRPAATPAPSGRAAMAKWLRRLGHEVTVLTTSAYGALDDDALEDVVRTADRSAARPARAATTRSTRCSTPTPTRGRPHPLSKVLRPRAAGRRLGAVRALARAAAAARAPLRLRDHDLAARVRPRRRPGAAPPRRPLGRRRPRRVDVRAAAAARSRPPRSAALDGASSAAGSAPPTPSSASAEPAAADLRERGIAEPLLVIPTAGTPRRSARPPRPTRSCSTPSAPRSSTPAASAATGATRGRSSRPSAGSAAADPEAAAKLELVIAGPLTRRRGGAVRRRRRTGADRPARQPRARAGAGTAARGRRAAAARPADALASCSTSSCSSTSRAARPILALAAGTEAGRVAGELGGRGRRRRRPGGDRGRARQGRRR